MIALAAARYGRVLARMKLLKRGQPSSGELRVEFPRNALALQPRPNGVDVEAELFSDARSVTSRSNDLRMSSHAAKMHNALTKGKCLLHPRLKYRPAP